VVSRGREISTGSPLAFVLSVLERRGRVPRRVGSRHMALCPAHDDRRPSLSICEGNGGCVLIRCWAGCDTAEILRSLGINWSDLFARGPVTTPPKCTMITRTPIARRAASPPPRDAVLGLWNCGRPANTDEPALHWLVRRGLDPDGVAERDLCRALPRDAKAPAWARCAGAPWTRSGHRVLVPLFDASGAMVSVHARSDHDSHPKGALPAGHTARGLVLADAAGRALLQTRALSGHTVWIVEGVPDFLSCSLAWTETTDSVPAVLGILAGSWSNDVACRLPDGARVVIAVHHDHAGERYLEAIKETLVHRCELLRWRPRGFRT